MLPRASVASDTVLRRAAAPPSHLPGFCGTRENWLEPEGLTLTGSLSELEPGDMLETCTILTTEANATLAPLHPRMPAILPPDAYTPWLAGETVPLAPYPADAMTFHPVSTLVNKPANDDERCVESVGRNGLGLNLAAD